MTIPKVSIIVPVYNVEKYLSKCIDSLLNQTLDSYEIILVNDGSTDGSQLVIDRYKEFSDQKIRAYKKKNGGLSDARNFGLEIAKGEYIGFVDSDDYVTSEMFEDMYTRASTNNADIAICNLQKVDEKGNIRQNLVQIPNMPKVFELKSNLSVFSDIGYFACNKIFKKSLFDYHRFKKGVHFEDIQLIPQLFLQSNILVQTQAYHYKYLERESSISKTHNEKGLDIFEAIQDVEEAFKKSIYKDRVKGLRGFQILEGVYSFLAYLAFVKDDYVYEEMLKTFDKYLLDRKLSKVEILKYKRFGKNYLLSLPLKKKIYYLFFFLGMNRIVKKVIN